MPSLESLSSRTQKAKALDRELQKTLPKSTVIITWILRVLVGGLFVVSGVSKAIDLWGVIYKIEEYLTVWGLDIPRSVVVMGALLLSMWEALLGMMLFLGCYRRFSVRLLTLLMAFMLALSLYIWVKNPVADCGCFGDFIKLSNFATFLKNILIVSALIYLWKYNYKVIGLISKYIQWIAGFLVVVYLLIVSMVGYNMQPLIDFREFPVGSSLTDEETEDDSNDVVFEFIYEKDGIKKTFLADELPDSTWTFVDREVVNGEIDSTNDFIIYENGEDVTADVISDEGEMLMVLIPEIDKADISYTFYINALARHISENEGELIGVLATDEEGLNEWRDLSLAEYQLYTADPTSIKSLARGNIALVYIVDGKIKWKRSVTSIDGEELIADIDTLDMSTYSFDGPNFFKYLSLALTFMLLLIIFADGGRRILRWHFLSNKKNNVNLHKENNNNN